MDIAGLPIAMSQNRIDNQASVLALKMVMDMVGVQALDIWWGAI